MSDDAPSELPATGRIARTSAALGSRTMRDLDRSSIMAVELLAGVLVWGGLGWWVGTTVGGHPWLFIIGSLVGFAGGMYLVWLRAFGRVAKSPVPTTPRSATDRDAGVPDRPPVGDPPSAP